MWAHQVRRHEPPPTCQGDHLNRKRKASPPSSRERTGDLSEEEVAAIIDGQRRALRELVATIPRGEADVPEMDSRTRSPDW